MTRFSDAVEKVRNLPEDRQELAAELLMNLVSGDAFDVGLEGDQLAEIERAKQDADAGDFASDTAVETMWRKHGA